MSEQPSTAKTIFLNALEISSPEAQRAYISAQCGDDEPLLAEVQTLLRHHEELGSFLEPTSAATLGVGPLAEGAGTMIGPYKLLEQIGEGGMGIVFMAEQQEPVRRKVAIKLIKPGMDTRQVIARFEAERQALAVMDHPGIARVLDAGATQSGHPYFVMELVRGVPITRYCDENNVPIRERLELFAAVCQAIQHAHTKGIIHRDIKPTNVLVARQDGRPAVKVIDFGVAKAVGQQLTERTLFTNFAQIIGTPLYMSPEQAEQSGVDIDTRSDIYSLGVLLYELLTGSTPVSADQLNRQAFDEIRRIIREEEPPAPSARISGSHTLPAIAAQRHIEPARLTRLVRGELDWIVMKALEKDRRRRYETANALAMDLSHYLNDEPVLACPPAASYRFRKFARRNRVALTTAGLVAAALVLGTVASTWQAIRAEAARAGEAEQRQVAETARAAEARQRSIAESERTEARRQRDLTRRNLYFANIKLAHQDWNVGHLTRMRASLDALRPGGGMPDLRGWEWYYLRSLTMKQRNVFHPRVGPIDDVRWAPNGRLVAIAGSLGVKVYEPISQQVVHFFPGHAHVAWSANGPRFMTAAIDRQPEAIRIWDTENWQELFAVPGSDGPIHSASLSADGREVAWSGGKTPGGFHLWEEGQAMPSSFSAPVLDERPPATNALAWAPDGRVLAMGGAFSGSLAIWDRQQQTAKHLFEAGRRGVSHLAWSPDGKRLATASIDGDIGLWGLDGDEPFQTFAAHQGQVSKCSWSADGKWIASGGEDNLVRLWDAETGKQWNRLPGHLGNVSAVDWSSKEDWIVSGSYDETVRFWRPDESQDAKLVPGRGTVAWSPDGNRIVSNDPRQGDDQTYSVRDPRTGQMVLALQSALHGSMRVFAWSPNSKMVAAVSMHDSAHVWDADTGRLLLSIPNAHASAAGDLFQETRCIAWSPDNQHFATCGRDRAVKIWETSSGKLLQTFSDSNHWLGSVAWSPDGRWFAAANWGRDIKVRATDTWRIHWEIDQDPALIGAGAAGDYTIAWGPDSRRLAAVNASGQIVLWSLLDAKAAEKLWSVEAHTSIIRSISWSPDGARIASGSEDRTVKILDAASGQELLTLDGFSGMVCAVAWSPDSRRLAAAEEGALRIWDAGEAYEILDAAGGANRPEALGPQE